MTDLMLAVSGQARSGQCFILSDHCLLDLRLDYCQGLSVSGSQDLEIFFWTPEILGEILRSYL